MTSLGDGRSSPTILAFKRNFTQSSRRHLRCVEDDHSEDSSSKDELETEATGRLIGEGIDAVIDYEERASRERMGKNGTEEGTENRVRTTERSDGQGEGQGEGWADGMGMDDLPGGIFGEYLGDLGVGDIIGEVVGGFVDF